MEDCRGLLLEATVVVGNDRLLLWVTDAIGGGGDFLLHQGCTKKGFGMSDVSGADTAA